MKTFAVFTYFVENAAEMRAPYREAHLAHLRALNEKGTLVLGGALVDPLDAGLLIMRADDKADIELLLAGDPYAQHGVWTKIVVREWNVVVGKLD